MIPEKDSINEIVVQLLRYQESDIEATEEFRSRRHNDDLCPAFKRQLDRICESYRRVAPIVYDTQGIRDDGTDVLIRCTERHLPKPSIIGFQIKSHDDLRERDYLQNLKAQRDDSFRKVQGLDHYYIVICTDAEKDKNRIRNIAAEFRSADRTIVVEPTFALTFLSLYQSRIDAFIKRALTADDWVLKRALDTLKMSSPTASGLAVYLIVKQLVDNQEPISVETLQDCQSLRQFYREARLTTGRTRRRFSFEQLANDLQMLEEQLIEIEDQTISVRRAEALPVLALASDAMVRFDYTADTIFPYLLNLLGIQG